MSESSTNRLFWILNKATLACSSRNILMEWYKAPAGDKRCDDTIILIRL